MFILVFWFEGYCWFIVGFLGGSVWYFWVLEYNLIFYSRFELYFEFFNDDVIYIYRVIVIFKIFNKFFEGWFIIVIIYFCNCYSIYKILISIFVKYKELFFCDYNLI